MSRHKNTYFFRWMCFDLDRWKNENKMTININLMVSDKFICLIQLELCQSWMSVRMGLSSMHTEELKHLEMPAASTAASSDILSRPSLHNSNYLPSTGQPAVKEWCTLKKNANIWSLLIKTKLSFSAPHTPVRSGVKTWIFGTSCRLLCMVEDIWCCGYISLLWETC